MASRILYCMTSELWGSIALARRQLKVARFDDLNDPFELLSARMGDSKSRPLYRELKAEISKGHGLLCFGTHWRSPVMWAHYGDKHKGLCLGFEVTGAQEVMYEPERLRLKLEEVAVGRDFNAAVRHAAMTTKFEQWSYEEEWRVVVPLRSPHPDGNFYKSFDQTMQLVEVVIGSRCNLTQADLAGLVGSPEREVTITKARAAFTTFTVKQDRRHKPVIVGGQRAERKG